MSEKIKLFVDQQQTFLVGEDTFVDSISDNKLAVIFEDNCETGYFYAVDCNNDQEILDALHIYNVESVTDKHKASEIKILWTDDSSLALLVINDYCHAVFDFKNKAGYCRNAFPESNNDWTKLKERKLTDELLEELLN